MITVVEQAILQLDGLCDGALERDGQGWNKFDAPIGHSLAQWITSGKPLTIKQRKLVAKILPKYRNQFHNWDQIQAALPGWINEANTDPIQKTLKTQRGMSMKLPKLDFDEGYFFIKTSYDDNWIPKSIPRRRWVPERKVWRFLNTDEVKEKLLEMLDHFKTVTETARAELEAYIKEKEQQEQAKKEVQLIKNQDNVELDIPLKTKLYDHQKKAAKIGITLDSSALLMEQGTGKTLAAIAVATYRYLKGQIKRILIIAPKSVLPEWERQFAEHTYIEHNVVALYGKREKKERILQEWKDTDGLQGVIINYESVWRLEDELKKWKPDMIICDESQKIKNARAKQSRAVIRLGKLAKYRMILTGTPVTQNPLDIFSQYLFLDPSIFGTSFTSFRNRYAVMGGFNNYQIIKFKNLEELAEKAHSIAYRVTKEEALDLPDVIHQNVYAELEPKAMKLYREMAEQSLVKIGDEKVTAPIVLTQLMKLQQIAGGFVKTEDERIIQVSKAKLEVLRELVEDLVNGQGKKLVIFARFIQEIKAISEILDKLDIKHHVLTGQTKNRGDIIQDFQNNPETKVFIINPKAGGTGITLTAADTAIFYSKDYSLEAYLQAIARIHRIGQTKKVTYIHIIARGTVDEAVTNRLNKKQDLATTVVDDLKNIFREVEGMEALTEKLEALKRTIERGEKITEKALEELQQWENEEEAKLDDLNEQVETKKKAKRKKSKKSKAEKGKETMENKEKSSKKVANDGIVKLADLAEELGIEPAALRRKLRENKVAKPGTRWEWPEDHPDLEKIKELVTKKPKNKKAKTEEE